jgi:hypothetical protein
VRGIVRGSFAILLFSSICAGQSLTLDFGQDHASFELKGKTLHGHFQQSNEDLTEDFDFTADITALNLDSVLSDSAPPAYFVFNCKDGQSGCVRTTSHTCQYKTSYDHPPCVPEFTGDATNAFIGCADADAYQRCVSFLAAVRAAAGLALGPPQLQSAPGREQSTTSLGAWPAPASLKPSADSVQICKCEGRNPALPARLRSSSAERLLLSGL